MKRPRCSFCRTPIIEIRGHDRVRFTISPIVIRIGAAGQAIEGVCRSCHRDVSLPLPLPADFFGVDRAGDPGVTSP